MTTDSFCLCGTPGQNVLALGHTRPLDAFLCATGPEFAGRVCRKASWAEGALLDEEREEEPDDGGAGEQGVDAVKDAAVAGEQRAHVLDGQVALDH